MASFVMQVLGFDVSTIDTVRYSNHLGYKQATGRKTTAAEVAELYQGLAQAHLDDFTIMLTGYCPDASVVEEVGRIVRAKKENEVDDTEESVDSSPDRVFWVLDPVMGDNGKLYVDRDTVPVYKGLLKHADLILPNQFETELLSGVEIHDQASLFRAIALLHEVHHVPHIVVTSVNFPICHPDSMDQHDLDRDEYLYVVGSTMTHDFKPQIFYHTVRRYDTFFSGAGDMFAGLVTAHFHSGASLAGSLQCRAWLDEPRTGRTVSADALPLAIATEKALGTVSEILSQIHHGRPRVGRTGEMDDMDATRARLTESDRHILETKDVEIRITGHIVEIRNPPRTHKAVALPGS